MKKYFISIMIISMAFSLHAQTIQPYYQNNDIPFINQQGDTLKNPFGGGLQFPVFSSMDLNFDYIPDLVILDKIDNRILTFVNEGKKGEISYTYRPQYEHVFSEALSSFIILKDYNNDGKPDIFTYSGEFGAGIGVYKNISDLSKNRLEFQLEYDYLETYFYGNFAFKINFPMFIVDIPSVIDYDRDGDLDILCFDELGGAWMQYYENMSMELFNSPDSLIYNCIDMSWGNFMENDQTNEVSLYRVRPWYYKYYDQNYDSIKQVLGYKLVSNKNPVNDPKRSFRGDRHAGSTVFAHDLDGDTDIDLLIGDVEYPGINLLRNAQADSGYKQARIFQNNLSFPMSKPVQIKNMPTLAYIDLDNDGVKDMIFSPTDMDIVDSFQNLNQIWIYKNIGRNDSLDLQFVKDDFLQDQMIDLGGATAPAFYDYDQDGDDDLFVATRGDFMDTYHKSDFIVLYENIGSRSEPVFRALDSNYLDLRKDEMNFIVPAFGDVDNDGDKDLLLGMKNGRLRFFENSAGIGNTAVFQLNSTYFDSIDVGDYSAPFIYDMDMDGYDDLVIGSNDGTIEYYKNNNAVSYPLFTKGADTFGNIVFHGGERQFITPAIADLDTNGYAEMVVGYTYKNNNFDKLEGNIAVYVDVTKNLTTDFIKQDSFIFDSAIVSYSNRYLGTYIRPSLANLDQDSFPDLVLGSDRGGLMYYNTKYNKEIVSIPENRQNNAIDYKIYPNPAGSLIFISSSSKSGEIAVELFDLTGKIIKSDKLSLENRNAISVSGIPSGIYILKISDKDSNSFFTDRLIKF